MSLRQDLKASNDAGRARIDADTLAVMDRATDAVRASGLADSALTVGDSAPTFSLPNASGETVALSDVLASGPVILTFYRGGWCPYCNLELRAYQALLPEIEAAGATLVAVSPQTPDASLTTQEKKDLTFTVLSDEGNAVARQFGLVHTLPADLVAAYDQFGLDVAGSNGDASGDLPLPATYVIDPDGTIRYAFVDADYTKRAEPSEVLASLQAVAA
ncbi:peroxiredoxin-like family protein [Rubricoccus marinus]|uniref:thioredoxin-dependent peroxiredoxin n=1 Tax=Rubricoccus marinus TaxID=716817 RepID=A0A259U305_9BACT|nr:peroxiredoxin-like family protein [Rubricoccus marinus]OZC04371.1 alkyl hydroperoxide reductase [Rubricoccus marinus]